MYIATLLLSLMCWVVVGYVYVRSPLASVFHPFSLYYMFHGLLFVIRPIIAHWLDFHLIYNVYKFVPNLSDKITVIAASTLGFLVFAFFSLRFGNVPMRFKQDAVAVSERNRLVGPFLMALLICAPLGYYSLYQHYNSASVGVVDKVLVKGTGVFVNANGFGYLEEAQTMLISCTAIFAWLFRFRPLALTPLLVFAVARAGTGGRFPIIYAAAAIGLMWMYENRQRFPAPRVLALSVAVLGIFTAVGQDRGRAVRQWLGTDYTLERTASARETPTAFMEGMDFGNLEYFEYIVYVVPQRSHTYDYFLNNLQLFTEPVPRVLWPDKPAGSPITRFSLFDYGSPIGMTRSLPGEGWYSLGWLGVIIVCGAWGAALGAVYRRYVESEQDTIVTATYIMFMTMMINTMRDGTLLTLARESLFVLAPVFLWAQFTAYLGIPRAHEVRNRLRRALLKQQITAALARTQAGAVEADAAEVAAPGADSAARPRKAGSGGSVGRAASVARWQSLPAAVRRRRALLRPPPSGAS
jgi:hypothetical protein